MLLTYLSKIRLFSVTFILFCSIIACAGKTGGDNGVVNNESIIVSTVAKPTLGINDSTTIAISIANLITTESVNITSSNESVITVTPNNCSLSTSSNLCTATITGLTEGTGTITVSSANLESVTTEIITVVSDERLVISSPTESTLATNGSTTVTVSIANIKANQSVALTSNDGSVISVTPSSCNLSTTINSCVATITALSEGTGTITASSANLSSVTSNPITVLPTVATGIVFGNMEGLILKNNTVLAGDSAFSSVDNSYVYGLVMDTNHTLYAGTFGSFFGGFGAGKVFKYKSSLGYWDIISGDGPGGSLDGSAINTLAIDSNNNLYAGTEGGNVFKYTNGVWVIMGFLLNDPVDTIYIDSSNNVYVGTHDNGNVFKFVNGTWQNFGAPDGSSITAITSNTTGDLFTATAGNPDGQVYTYDIVGNTWNSISSFNDGSVNALTIYNNTLYSGTNAGNLYDYDGSTWNSLGTTPDTSPIITIMVNSTDTYIGSEGTSDNGQVYQYNSGAWTALGTLNNGEITNILMQNNELYTSTANNGNSMGSVYRYANGGWLSLGRRSLDSTPVASITTDNNGNYYAGTQNNVYKYSLTNNTWSLLGNMAIIDGSGAFTMAIHNNTLYAGTSNGNILRSSINNGNWVLVGSPQANSSVSSLKINATGQIYTSINDNSVDPIIGSVWTYENNVWTMLTSGGSTGSADSTAIQSIVLDSDNNVYAATTGTGSGGFVWKYTATDNAWSIVGLGTLDASAVVSLTINNSTLYAGTNAGNIFKYNGITWELITTTPLDGSGVSNIIFNGDDLYATTYGGNIWEYVPNTHLWVNTNYGLGTSINVGGAFGF